MPSPSASVMRASTRRRHAVAGRWRRSSRSRFQPGPARMVSSFTARAREHGSAAGSQHAASSRLGGGRKRTFPVALQLGRLRPEIGRHGKSRAVAHTPAHQHGGFSGTAVERPGACRRGTMVSWRFRGFDTVRRPGRHAAAFEGFSRVRIGDVLALEAREARELTTAPLAHGIGHVADGVVGEELEGRACSPRSSPMKSSGICGHRSCSAIAASSASASAGARQAGRRTHDCRSGRGSGGTARRRSVAGSAPGVPRGSPLRCADGSPW